MLIAAVVGAALWVAVSMMSGRGEAWDSSAYWALAYPLAILVSALLGYFYPERTWRWPLVLFAAQFVAMVVRSSELGGLWPLGLVMFGILSLPAVLAARLAARLGRRSADELH